MSRISANEGDRRARANIEEEDLKKTRRVRFEVAQAMDAVHPLALLVPALIYAI